MFHKILVAMDQSAMGRRVFDDALNLAKTMNADLMLLHVLTAEEDGSLDVPIYPAVGYFPTAGGLGMEHYHQRWQVYEEQGLDLLQSRSEEAMTTGINAEFTQVVGDPGRTICQQARDWNADLIVVGRRGRSGLSELFLGSVSNYVLHHAHCSVMIIQPSGSSDQPDNELSEATQR